MFYAAVQFNDLSLSVRQLAFYKEQKDQSEKIASDNRIPALHQLRNGERTTLNRL